MFRLYRSGGTYGNARCSPAKRLLQKIGVRLFITVGYRLSFIDGKANEKLPLFIGALCWKHARARAYMLLLLLLLFPLANNVLFNENIERDVEFKKKKKTRKPPLSSCLRF